MRSNGRVDIERTGAHATMDLVREVVGSDVRRRWRSWLVVTLLTGFAAGASMAAFAGWERTTSAMERYLDEYRPFNAYVEGRFTRDDVEAIAGVEATAGGDYFLLVPIDGEGVPRPEQLGTVSPFSSDDPGHFQDFERAIVVDGRLADPAVETEVVVDEELAESHELRPGSTLTMQGYAPDQVPDLFDTIGSLVPEGLVFDFTVTGIIRQPQDVQRVDLDQDVVYLGSAAVFLGPAFHAAHVGRDVPSLGAIFGDARPAGQNGFEVRIDFDRVSRAGVEERIRALDPDAFVQIGGNDAAEAAEEAGRSIDLQSALLAALGVLVGAGGALLASQGIRRQLDADHRVQASLRVLGASRRQLLVLSTVKAVAFATASVIVAVGVAIGLSVFMPVGHARHAEIDPGVDADVAVLGASAAIVVVVVTASMVSTSWRRLHGRRRVHVDGRRTLAHRAGQAGLSPPVVAGCAGRSGRRSGGGGGHRVRRHGGHRRRSRLRSERAPPGIGSRPVGLDVRPRGRRRQRSGGSGAGRGHVGGRADDRVVLGRRGPGDLDAGFGRCSA